MKIKLLIIFGVFAVMALVAIASCVSSNGHIDWDFNAQKTVQETKKE